MELLAPTDTPTRPRRAYIQHWAPHWARMARTGAITGVTIAEYLIHAKH